MAVLPLRPNRLVYPGAARTGFNPAHIANKYPYTFSAIGTSNNFINVLTGAPGTLVSSPASAACAFGNLIGFGAGANSVTFAAGPAVNFSTFTMAAIVIFTNTGFDGNILISSKTGGGCILRIISGTLQAQFTGYGSVGLGISPPQNVPVFLALSTDLNTADCVMKNLSTGSVVYGGAQPVFGGPFVTQSGPVAICGVVSTINSSPGFVAAAMINASTVSARLGKAALLEWADDPWSFWYPQPIDFASLLKTTAAAAGFIPAWAMNSNLPVLGTGTY